MLKKEQQPQKWVCNTYEKLVPKQNFCCTPGFAGDALRLSGGIDNTDDMIYHVSAYLESP